MEIVKDLMVPLADCATVDQETTIYQAILAMKTSRNKQVASDMPSRLLCTGYPALLVLDDESRVVGKLGQTDIVLNLDPNYQGHGGVQAIAHTATAGLSPALLKSLVQWDSLWNESFEHRCRQVLNLKVKDWMCGASSEERVLESDPLQVGIHKLAIGYHQSLLVTGNGGVTGILRLSDIFEQIARGTGNPIK